MRASRALFTLLTAPTRATLTTLTTAMLACGGTNDGGSASSGGQTTDPTATSEAADTDATTTSEQPTSATSEPITSTTSTTAEPTSETTTDPTSTGNDSTSSPATSTTDGSSTGLVSASDTSTTSTGTTNDTSTTSETGTTGPACPEGQVDCPCAANDACDPGLACTRGVCGPAPFCGDGQLDPGEQCDDGPGNGDDKPCKLDCSAQVCGDGQLGPGEQCDDGNQTDGDGCQKNCTPTPAPLKDACGFDSDGVWFQIDYSNAFTVTNPSYTYSPTPGWGEAQWAPAGKDWPYAVDLFDNASVVNDQIGKVALLNGTNKAVRVYFGLAGLNYTYATVCVEGRSYSVGSPVQFFVMEAKTKCGDYGSMAQDWTVHATGIDMQDCFLPGDDFQAVQVQPSSGSGALSLKRLRVTLHGATY